MLLSPLPRQRRKSNKIMCNNKYMNMKYRMRYRIIEQQLDRGLFECACRLNDVNIISIEERVSMDGKDKLLSIVVDVKYEEDLYYVGRYIGRMLEDE